jgi:hypothetical protein
MLEVARGWIPIVTLLPVYIAFPWLRDVPEGISSGTWGQNDPAGSLLASETVRRRKREKLVPKKPSGKDASWSVPPCGVRAGGTDKQLSHSWFTKVEGE